MIEIPTVAPPALNRPPDLCCKIKLGGGREFKTESQRKGEIAVEAVWLLLQ